MYRYLLFAYRSYEERGGIADLVLTFNTVEELLDDFVENLLEELWWVKKLKMLII